MTRTLKAIKGVVIYFENEEVKTCTIKIPVRNFSEKEIDKAISKCEKDYDYKIVRKTIKKLVITTKMSENVWWHNCDIVSEAETEEVDENDSEATE